MIKLLMGGGATVVGWLFGTAGFIAVLVTASTLGFQRWELHKAGLRGEGRMMCTLDFEQAARESERIKAAAEIATASQLLDAERQATRGLHEQLEQLEGEYATLKAESASAPTLDPSRCLSDGVYEKLGGRAKVSTGVEGKATDSKPFAGH